MATGAKKFSKKRKEIEDKVLAKARKYVKLSIDEETAEQHPTSDTLLAAEATSVTPEAKPKVKVRKPRWDEEKFEERRRELQAAGKDATTPKPTADGKQKKKTKKKKRKKKKQQEADESLHAESEKKHAEQALDYLQRWSTNRDEWKFEKLKQIWLLKHALNASLIGEDDFESLLNYIESIKGKARTVFMSEMVKIVEEYDSKSNLSEEDKVKYERARQIIQMLHDDSD